MSKFCEFCGKPTNNSICDCEEYLSSVKTTTQVQQKQNEVHETTASIQSQNVIQEPKPQQSFIQQPQQNVQQPINQQIHQPQQAYNQPMYSEQPGYQQIPPQHQQAPQYQQPVYQQVPPQCQQSNYQQTSYQQVPPQPQQANYQQAPQPTSQFVAASKEQFTKSKNLFMQFIKNPIGMMSEIATIEDKKSPYIFGIIHALIIFLYVYLKTSVSKLSIIVACVIFAISLITAVITFGFAKKYDANADFAKTLSLFFIATIPASIMILASLILTYVYVPLALLMLAMAFLSWIIIGYIATQESIKADKNKVFWIYFIVIALVIIAASIIVKATTEQMIQDFISSLNLFDLF